MGPMGPKPGGRMPPPPPVGDMGMMGAPKPPTDSSMMGIGPPPPIGDIGDDSAENSVPEGGGAPGFKTADEVDSKRCWNCKNWDDGGSCKKYGNPAEEMDTCDGYEPGAAAEGGESEVTEEPLA